LEQYWSSIGTVQNIGNLFKEFSKHIERIIPPVRQDQTYAKGRKSCPILALFEKNDDFIQKKGGSYNNSSFP